ncbi:MAG: arsenic efflux protein [Lachnospiraceae bacterium]|nr:arsenic efflux protein [Lachnospiraceae bacterium]MBR1852017.1 arsenic efflux protein [Lachnospiraceae bacterium]
MSLAELTHAALHAVEHTLEDSILVILVLFFTYLAMEYLEHRAGDKLQQVVEKAGRLGPVIGAAVGVVPQCGFSAAASNLYAGRVITMGTLIAIYLSTSDEMLPVMISAKAPASLILSILAIKVAVGIIAGFMVDLAFGQGQGEHKDHGGHKDHAAHNGHESHEAHEGHESHETHGGHKDHAAHGGHKDHAAHNGHESHETHEGHEHHTRIHEMCEQEHCDCEKGILHSAVKHTVHVGIFLLFITFALNFLLEIVGEDVLSALLLDRPIAGPVIAGIVGLIPNCAASVAITELYLGGMLGLGSMLSGLLVGAGVGLLVLFRVNRHTTENLKITGILYCVGVFAGIVIEYLI